MKVHKLFDTRSINGQWRLVAAMITCFAIVVSIIPLTGYVKYPVVILLGFIASQFMFAAHRKVLPQNEPLFVKKFDELKSWWDKVSRPAFIGEFEGKPSLQRQLYCDFAEYYNQSGRYIGTIQTINWSDTDMNWKPGMEDEIQIIVKQADPDDRTRLPFIARFRSSKLL